MSEGEDSLQRFTKEWVREEWDEEKDTASKGVQITKIIHEWHIAVPGLVLGLAPAVTFYIWGTGTTEIIGSYFGVAFMTYRLLFPHLWCSTLAE